jgi:chromosome segregation ATPase
MTSPRFVFPCLWLLLATTISTNAQQEQDPILQRMRDAMKKLAQRISEAETQMVNAQAAQLQAEASLKEMTARQETTAKQLKDEIVQGKAYKEQSQRRIQELEAKVQAQEKALSQYVQALEKWKEGFEKARDIAMLKEGERVQAVAKALEQERKASAHERKNRELYALAEEILEKFKSFGLGTAIIAREPFIGSMRVKFENYVQDYGRKVDEAKVKPNDRKNEVAAGALPQEAPVYEEPPPPANKPAP